MKVSRLVPFALCLLSPFAACNCGNEDAGDAGASGSESTGSETGSGTSSTTLTSTSGVDGSGGSGGSDESGTSSGGMPTEVMILGIVFDYFGGEMNPVADAELSVYDIPGVTATSDAMGAFTLGPLPPNTEIAIVIAPSMDYMGGVFPYSTPATDETDAAIPQISRMTVQMQMDGIADQMPAMPDLNQSIMIVGNKLMSEVIGAVIDVVPAPLDGTYYAPDDMGFPVVNEHTLTWGVLSVVVYFNVPEYAPGDVMVTATHPTATCTITHPEFPTIGEHVTFVEVEC